MERKPEWFSIQSLRQDDALGVTIRKMSANEWLWADALRRDLRWAALDRDDSRALYWSISNGINNTRI